MRSVDLIVAGTLLLRIMWLINDDGHTGQNITLKVSSCDRNSIRDLSVQ